MDSDDFRIRRWGTIGDGYLGPAFHMRFKPGHVLYGSRRTYLRKVAVADFEAICANTTFVLEPSTPELLPEYLPLVMTTEAFHAHSVEQSKGSVNPYVNFRDLGWYEFVLPSTEYQRDAVELLAACQASVTRAEEVASALTGLSDALGEDASHRAVAEGSVVRLDDLVDPSRWVTSGIRKPIVETPDGVAVVKVKDYPANRIQPDTLVLAQHELDVEYKRARLLPNDIVVSIRGTVGRVALVPDNLGPANITQDSARVALADQSLAPFVWRMLAGRFVQTQFAQLVRGLAVQGINVEQVKEIRVPLPAEHERRALLAEFEAVDRAIESQRQFIKQTLALRSAVREHVVGFRHV